MPYFAKNGFTCNIEGKSITSILFTIKNSSIYKMYSRYLQVTIREE